MSASTYNPASIFFYFFLLLFASCEENKVDDHGHAHAPAAHDDHAAHGDQKTVQLNEAQYRNAEIKVGWFEDKNLSEVINANGYTKVDARDQAEVSMPINGNIRSIKVIEGDYVKKGSTIATMHSLEYNGMLLEKAKLVEKIGVANARRTYLQAEYDRQQILSTENINAKKIFQKVSAELREEQAKIAAVSNQLQLLDQSIQMIGEGTSSLINIPAPISGYITKVMVKIGSAVSPDKVLFSMVDNSKIHVDLLVYEKDLSKVKKGQTVRFILTNQSNKEITGKIYNIGQAFENETKSVAVHVDIEKNDAKLIPGMYVNALIEIGSNKVQTLPEGALVHAEGRDFVFILEKETSQAKGHAHAADGSHPTAPAKDDGHGHAHEENDGHAHEEDDGHAHEEDDGHAHAEDGGHAHEEDDGHGHAHGAAEKNKLTFTRVEVKRGPAQLGVVQVTALGDIHKGDQIVTQGAYYLQSHLQKAEGGGGHSH